MFRFSGFGAYAETRTPPGCHAAWAGEVARIADSAIRTSESQRSARMTGSGGAKGGDVRAGEAPKVYQVTRAIFPAESLGRSCGASLNNEFGCPAAAHRNGSFSRSSSISVISSVA